MDLHLHKEQLLWKGAWKLDKQGFYNKWKKDSIETGRKGRDTVLSREKKNRPVMMIHNQYVSQMNGFFLLEHSSSTPGT